MVVLSALVPALSSAQDGLRSASLPERPLSSSSGSMREDLYRTGPGRHRLARSRPSWPVFGYFGPEVVYPYVQPIIVVVPRDPVDPARAMPRAMPAPVAPPAPYVAGMAGRPKTFYVIPGCYAGDRRPEPESLAPGCSLTRLRVVAPS